MASTLSMIDVSSLDANEQLVMRLSIKLSETVYKPLSLQDRILLDRSDLVQEGFMAGKRAIPLFDNEKTGHDLQSFLWHRIRHGMLDAVKKTLRTRKKIVDRISDPRFRSESLDDIDVFADDVEPWEIESQAEQLMDHPLAKLIPRKRRREQLELWLGLRTLKDMAALHGNKKSTWYAYSFNARRDILLSVASKPELREYQKYLTSESV